MDREPLVIFDCDGVLVDSEPIAIDVLCETLREAGLPIDAEFAYARCLGRSMASTVDILASEFGFHVDSEHLRKIRSRLYERFRAELKPVPGIVEALAVLPGRRCVASSSQPERIRLSLAVTGLLESFEPHIYSATEVKTGKPAPDLFLHAARAMGCSPDRCIVVEDSPAGIEAARRAGMAVFGFVGGSHVLPGDLVARVSAMKPDLVFDDMHQLPGLIRGRMPGG
ncbi:6-phosphogluconate phosphatase [Hartmannibacter diazotrophicus]|uniref:6-phosphogluconate phosphatase n=1 Tax=Hartmannibacter diazotrophicus TaxID=1482074 RepID=A0A2C9DD55_9HYPH|nr:HAD-IA family hydrolase [Hartmannibacter diazotrophicus]SON58110.1 6-phosphogluconate phosphatase [Hartmannibacter diazotrophicus]